MELYSENFMDTVENAFNSEKPFLAVIHKKPSIHYKHKKNRNCVLIFEISPENRDLIYCKTPDILKSRF